MSRLRIRIACGEWVEDADAPHTFALLRSRRERPRSHATQHTEKLPSPHVGYPSSGDGIVSV
jgi:hypothetical protein